MSLLALVPLKALDRAKTRLIPVLRAEERRSVVLAMARHVLSIVGKRADHMVIITDDHIPELARFEQLGVGEIGLNPALEIGRRALRHQAAALLVISADLPLLRTDEMDAMIAAAARGVAIAPDRSGEGTNAIACRADLTMPFCFGPSSFQRHRAAALRAGLTPIVVQQSGLATDIDAPAAYRAWQRSVFMAVNEITERIVPVAPVPALTPQAKTS